MKKININDIVYFSFANAYGGVIKVLVKDLEHFQINKDGEINQPIFIVKTIETIVEPALNSEKYIKSESFSVVEDYLHLTLDEAMKEYDDLKQSTIEKLKEKLKNQKQFLSFLNETFTLTEINSIAETKTINIAGKELKSLKDTKKKYYTFFEWQIENGFSNRLDYDSIVNNKDAFIYKVSVYNGRLNKSFPEIYYTVYVEKGVGVDDNEFNTYGIDSFSVERLHYFYNNKDSAIHGLKEKVQEFINMNESNIRLLEK